MDGADKSGSVGRIRRHADTVTGASPIQVVGPLASAADELVQVGRGTSVGVEGTPRRKAMPPLEQTRGPVPVGRVRFLPGAQNLHWAQQVAPILARLLHGADREAAIVCVTGASRADGSTRVARLMASTAARLPWCRTLLLDAHSGAESLSERGIDGQLPDLTESFVHRGIAEVANAESGSAEFHVAAIPPGPAWTASLVTRGLRDQLLPAYRLIILDCPPVLDQPYLPPLAGTPSAAVLVVRARMTPISLALRSKREIESVGGTLFGVVMVEERAPARRLLRHFR